MAVKTFRPLSAEDLADVERALAAAPPDASVYYVGGPIYACRRPPPHVKGNWGANPEALKERCGQLLRLAVENGHPNSWMIESSFQRVFGNPQQFAKDWKKPAIEPTITEFWQMGDPLKEFAG